MKCTLFSVQCAVQSEQHTVCCAQLEAYSVLCTVRSIQCAVYSVHNAEPGDSDDSPSLFPSDAAINLSVGDTGVTRDHWVTQVRQTFIIILLF